MLYEANRICQGLHPNATSPARSPRNSKYRSVVRLLTVQHLSSEALKRYIRLGTRIFYFYPDERAYDVTSSNTHFMMSFSLFIRDTYF